MNIIQVSGGELRIPVEKGGALESYVFSSSKYLSEAGHNVILLDRKYASTDPDVEYIDGVKLVRLKAKRFPRFNFTASFVLNQICFASQVRRYLVKADFDIIHVHSSVTGLILSVIAPSLRSKLFYTSHGSRRTKRQLTLLDKMALAVENQLAKRVKKVIVIDEALRTRLVAAARIRPEDVAMIPLGRDIRIFSPNLDVGDVRQRDGLNGRVVILFVGRIHADKGVEYLVKAANIVVNEFGDKKAYFLLVGPIEQFGSGGKVRSPYLAKILRLIEGYELQQNVKLTGALPLDDLIKLYVACDMFVIPSLADSGPAVSVEAMACGKPVIGTKVGSMPMQIKDKQSGFLIDPADERQLAEKIKYLIDNPLEAKDMGTYARKLAEEKFDWSKIAERLLQVYSDELR